MAAVRLGPSHSKEKHGHMECAGQNEQSSSREVHIGCRLRAQTHVLFQVMPGLANSIAGVSGCHGANSRSVVPAARAHW